MNRTGKILRILLSNVKAISFTCWYPKFGARAHKKKTSHIYLGTMAVPSDSAHKEALLIEKVSCSTGQKKTIKDVDLNIAVAAFGELILSMDDLTD